MQHYDEMTPDARFEALDQLARDLYGTAQWRQHFAAQFGIGVQTITNWKTGHRTPVWACVAIGYAIEAARLNQLRKIISGS